MNLMLFMFNFTVSVIVVINLIVSLVDGLHRTLPIAYGFDN